MIGVRVSGVVGRAFGHDGTLFRRLRNGRLLSDADVMLLPLPERVGSRRSVSVGPELLAGEPGAPDRGAVDLHGPARDPAHRPPAGEGHRAVGRQGPRPVIPVPRRSATTVPL